MCKVNKFVPSARIEAGKITSGGWRQPYATIKVQCVEGHPELPPNALATITHKIDFKNLWAAFIERGISDDEVVIIVRSKKYLRGYARIFAYFMPRMIVMIFKNHAFKLLIDPDFEPELKGEARFLAELPVEEWRPHVMR